MKTKDGKVKEVRIKKSGNYEVKVFRLIALEPALWDMFDRLSKDTGKTRSTYIRCFIKDNKKLKTSGVDWSETNEK